MNTQKRTLCIPILALVAVAAISATATRADTQYTYAGNAFTNYFQSITTAPLYSCTADVGECAISVEMTFATPLADNMAYQNVVPTSLIILDGKNILVEGQPGVTLYQGVNVPDGVEIGTDASGNIDDWDVDVRKIVQVNPFVDSEVEFLETSSGGDLSSLILLTGSTEGSNGDPGVWTTHSAVVPPPPPPMNTPEPGSLLLLGAGMLGLVGWTLKRGA